jgi:hypothetical protein
MRFTRCRHHKAVRELRKNEDIYKTELFAREILNNRNRNFWEEVKRIRGRRRGLPDRVDSAIGSGGIVYIFASKNTDLYSNVPCSTEELDVIAAKNRDRIKSKREGCENIIRGYEDSEAIGRLKSNKGEGACRLSSDFFY